MTVPTFKPAYLIHGDDHGRIGERRANLRSIAEAQSSASGVEQLVGDAAAPEAIAIILATTTLALGRRFIIVDGVERWTEKAATPVVDALATLPDETTVVFFAREDSRAKAPSTLHDAVRAAGGDVAAEMTAKAWELPKWVQREATTMGLELESGAAKALVTHVGERQQRLLRELEKLALELGPNARISVEDVEAIAAPSAERKVWTLADALVARDAVASTRVYVELRSQGERLAGLLVMIVRRLRDALDVSMRLDAGESDADVKRRLRMPSRAASRFVDDVRATDSNSLRRAIETFADLELASRGGGDSRAEDTAALQAIEAVTA